jgi:hypothetical protein
MKSYCSPLNKTQVLLYGAYFDLNPSSCIIKQSHICTWYDSSSLNCRRWSKLENLTVKVVFTQLHLQLFQDFDPNLKYTVMNIGLQTAVSRFVMHYNGQTFKDFGEIGAERFERKKHFNVFVISFLLFCVY